MSSALQIRLNDFATARGCIIRSIGYERVRQDQQDVGFEQYAPDNDKHLFAQPERELAAN